MSLVRCRMQLLVYLLWAEVPVSVGFSRTAVLFWSISSLCDPGWDLDSWIFSLLVCQVGRIRYKPYWLECETWGWSLTFPSCFPELLFMISLLPGSLGFFFCFFFFFCARSETWSSVYSVALWLFHDWAYILTHVQRWTEEKSHREIHYPFEIITQIEKFFSQLSFLWVSLVGGHHYQIVFGSQREVFALI